MRHSRVFMNALAGLILFGSAAIAEIPPPPETRTVDAADTLHGIVVPDPYRWLEDSLSPEVAEWTAAQTKRYEDYATNWSGYQKIRSTYDKYYAVGSVFVPYMKGNTFFITKRDSLLNQPVLYVQNGLKGESSLLMDPNALSADGTAAMDWWVPSNDGSLLAYGVSYSGSENTTLFLKRTDTKAMLADTIPRTRSASIAWLPDNSGFYYTRYPLIGSVPAGEENYYRRVYFHSVGKSWESDPLIFEDTTSKVAWTGVDISPDGRRLILTSWIGWDKNSVWYKDLSNPESPLVVVVNGPPALFTPVPLNDRLLIHTNDKAGRYKVMSASYETPDYAHWTEIIPERDLIINNVYVVNNQILIRCLRNSNSVLQLFTLEGKFDKEIKLPTLGTASGIAGEWNGSEMFFQFATFTIPPTIYRYDFTSGKMTEYDRLQVPIDLSKVEVRQVWYPSKDGTKISMFIVGPKGMKLDGSHYVWLTGYGGFNEIDEPYFARTTAFWLAQGHIFAMPNLRGNGEYGEDWHKAGMLGNKQNTFDDFIAAQEYLIKEKYTTTERLALYGGSNGGLLIGAMITQRPDLFKVAVCDVPLLDMVRYQQFRIARLWIPEYGSSEDSAQFDFIYKYSPYHHVRENYSYPPILFQASESDGRVDPLHARKMGAWVQKANTGPNPIFIRIEAKAGHGQGKPLSKSLDDFAMMTSFVMQSMGVMVK